MTLDGFLSFNIIQGTQRDRERDRELTNLKIEVKNDILVMSGYQTSEYDVIALVGEKLKDNVPTQ